MVGRLKKHANAWKIRKNRDKIGVKNIWYEYFSSATATSAAALWQKALWYLVKQAGVEDQFYINSAATSREEIGNPPHSGTVAKLKAEGIPVIPHRAVQMTLNDYEEYDYLIGMDTENIRNMQRLSGGDPDEKVYKLMTFAGSGSDVADPWYTGDFEATYKDVRKGCEGLLKVLMNL